jgi:hypothetical protein
LIKITLSAITVYTLISLSLPPWLHKALWRIMTAFLWTGTDVLQAGKCLVPWKRVQCPLQLGGLGVLDLMLFGIASRCRWLWLQHMALDRLWSSLQISEDSLTRPSSTPRYSSTSETVGHSYSGLTLGWTGSASLRLLRTCWMLSQSIVGDAAQWLPH